MSLPLPPFVFCFQCRAMQQKQHRIQPRCWGEEVRIELVWGSKGDLRRFKAESEGIENESIPTYLNAARKKYEEDLYNGGRGENGSPEQIVEEDARIVDVERFGTLETEGSGDLMVVGKQTHDRALFVRDWAEWNPKQMRSSAMPRPPAVKQMHAEHCMKNYRRAEGNEGIAPFIENWRDKITLIVGSGPSLRKAKEEIPAGDDRFRVIAINAAIQYLDAEQIDYAFIADRKADPDWIQDIGDAPLICTLTCPPEVVDEFDDVYFCRTKYMKHADDEQVLPYIMDLQPLDVAKTATYSAFHFCYRAGSPVIMFVGQDFSCTSKLYSATSELDNERAKSEGFFLNDDRVSDEDEVVLTCPRLVSNMSLIKGQAAFVGRDERHVINATGRGILNLEDHPNDEMASEFNRNLPLGRAKQFALKQIGKPDSNSEEVGSWSTNSIQNRSTSNDRKTPSQAPAQQS